MRLHSVSGASSRAIVSCVTVVVATSDEELAETAAEVLLLLDGSDATPLPRHRHRLTREGVRRSQTVRILAATIQLVATQGYAETTVLEIAKRAGVSRKTFYELYDSKEDVLLGCYQFVRVLISRTGVGGDDGDSPITPTPDTLAHYIGQALQSLAEAPAVTRMIFLEAVGAGPRVRARRNEAIEEFVAAITPPLQRMRALHEPALPQLDITLCRGLTAAAIELIVQHLAHHDPQTLPMLTSELTELGIAITTPNHMATGRSST